MISVLAIVHIVLCISLVVLVLVQDPKGGTASMFGGGGGSNSLFGATGAPSFLAKLTRYVAMAFAILCLWMTWAIKPKSTSVLDSVGLPAQQQVEESIETAPAQPAPTENTEEPKPE